MGVPKRSGGAKKGGGRAPPRQLTAEDHYMEAELAFVTDRVDDARASFRRALELAPGNAEFLDGYGAFLAEEGPPEEAAEVLARAARAAPDAGYEKFMYLGQVLDQLERPAEAEAALRRGLELLRGELATVSAAAAAAAAAPPPPPAPPAAPAPGGGGGDDDDEPEDPAEEKAELEADLSTGLCSLAELLMGAAAADAGAPPGGAPPGGLPPPVVAECEALLAEATALAPRAPEPGQALAMLRRLQGEAAEALAALKASMALWHKPSLDSGSEGGAAGADGSGDDAEAASMDEEEGDEPPPFGLRFGAAKLLLELEGADGAEAAADVLEGLLAEDDGVPDVWLLLAEAYRAGGELEAAQGAAAEGLDAVRAAGLPPGDDVAEGLEALAAELRDLLANAGGGGEE